MNAPENIAAVAHLSAVVPIEQLHASKTNPRKRFDKAAADELTESVKTHGILQPILVRPAKTAGADGRGPFEIVAGERRYRAAKAAGLAHVPAIIRQLSDVEALEMQVIENLQRSDLHPLEEAEGYEQLMKLHKFTADDLAAKVGKSRSYVYGVLKFCDLCPVGRKAFYEGRLTRSTALLIARIAGASFQERALEDIAGPKRGDPMSYRDAASHVHRNFMLQLKDAPFKTDDPKLIAKAGACGPCPRRTGNAPDLFGDVTSADVCTDPQCFNAKKAAHFAIVKALAADQGRTVITGNAAKEIVTEGYGGHVHVNGHHRLDDKCWDDPKHRTYRQLAKLTDTAPALVELPKSKDLVEVVADSAIKSAMRSAGLLPKAAASTARTDEKRRKEKARREFVLHGRIVDAIRARVAATNQVSLPDGVMVATEFWAMTSHVHRERLVQLYGWSAGPADEKPEKASQRIWQAIEDADVKIAAMDAAALWRLMIDISLMGQTVPHLADVATRHGVDLAAIKAEALADEKAKVKPGKVAAPRKAKAVA
ncbi:MAG: ParB/RepB/Spo0J family partition protein [Sinimarinibacterium sp.]|jgi:ParB/RepB/Spo0J family partition protein